jgi:hypothetical protein
MSLAFNRSGAAAVNKRLILSVSKGCHLTQIVGCMNVCIHRSPIEDAKLYQFNGVPLLVAEGKKGDVCIWNNDTGQIVFMVDNRHGPSFQHVVSNQ